MSVPNESPVNNYTGNGVTTKFPVTFQFETQNTLVLKVNGVVAPISDYYWTTDNSFNFYDAPASGAIIEITRNTPKKRDNDYDDNYNTFRPKTLNKDFDRLWRVIQEYLIKIDRNSAAIAQEIIDRIQADEDMLDYIMNQDNAIKQDYIQRDDVLKADYIERDETLKRYVDQLIALITDNPSFDGVDAEFVKDESGLSQQEINNGFPNISDLLSLNKPTVGASYKVNSYANNSGGGGGAFVYQLTTLNPIDNGIVFKAINASGYFIRISMEAIPQVTWYGAVLDGVTDDTIAVQRSFDSPITKAMFFTGMAKTTAELVVPRSKINFKLMSYGVTGDQTGGIEAYLTVSGSAAIWAKSYGCTLDGFSIISGTGAEDGLNLTGFLHADEAHGAVGRLTHKNSRIINFSNRQMAVYRCLNYTIDQLTLQGGKDGLYVGMGYDGQDYSTSLTIKDCYIGGQKRWGLDMNAVGDFRAIGCNIFEYIGGKTEAYAEAAAIHGVAIYPLGLNNVYFEGNFRNLNLRDCSFINNDPTYSGAAATNSDIIEFVNWTAAQRGNITFERGTISTNKLRGDFTQGDGVLELVSATYSTYNLIQQRKLTVGSSLEKGDVTAQSVELALNSNMNGAGNTGLDGATLNFGVCNSASYAGSGWIQQSIRRLDNTTGVALTYYHNTGTTKYNPDGTKRKLFELSNSRGAVFVPVTTTIAPINNGEMHFELTSNTQLTVKVKGSDGVVRSSVLTLA